ncbi:MAG: ABC transporter permease [Bdellovibrio sp. CG10_big_fil_rev_8_21_14_0_10_47_8]|nr:MAG: ABC transporter permease [Bdellovibrio sp. CG10_big_fil_rev_8_21_14_0_10_47_8]
MISSGKDLYLKRVGIWNVWGRNFLVFRKSWIVNLFWMVVEPTFVLFSIGYGVGAFISSIQGVAYVDFFFPALLCLTAMMVAFFETAYGSYSKLNFQKIYQAMILSPLEPKEIIFGEILWGGSKGFLSALGVTLVATVFGHTDNLLIIPALLVVFICAILFSSLGLLVVSFIKSHDQISVPTSGFIVPMSFICGTYFPLEQMPVALKYLVYLLPLTHAVGAVRGILLGGMPWWQIGLHILVLLLLTLLVVRAVQGRISKKLIH